MVTFTGVAASTENAANLNARLDAFDVALQTWDDILSIGINPDKTYTAGVSDLNPLDNERYMDANGNFLLRVRLRAFGVTVATSPEKIYTFVSAPPATPEVVLTFTPNVEATETSLHTLTSTLLNGGVAVTQGWLLLVNGLQVSGNGGGAPANNIFVEANRKINQFFNNIDFNSLPNSFQIRATWQLQNGNTVLSNIVTVTKAAVKLLTPCQPGQNAGDWQKDAFDLGFIPNVSDGENYGKAFPPIQKATEPMPVILPLPFS